MLIYYNNFTVQYNDKATTFINFLSRPNIPQNTKILSIKAQCTSDAFTFIPMV